MIIFFCESLILFIRNRYNAQFVKLPTEAESFQHHLTHAFSLVKNAEGWGGTYALRERTYAVARGTMTDVSAGANQETQNRCVTTPHRWLYIQQ